ncbi:MAG: hypothetical protein SP1CHLAM54_16910 [Chlamydiia bacterium]|nr:hypothetical protein [Chlamydiia bacterium]MCH9616579.1 hypothetical protein [Chlamydiia bacterium]MCH9629309.1 hypothetical protein [Chlamydiia bacterium]
MRLRFVSILCVLILAMKDVCFAGTQPESLYQEKKVIVSTIPKSGTHLIKKTCKLLAEYGLIKPDVVVHSGHYAYLPQNKLSGLLNKEVALLGVVRDLRDVSVSEVAWLSHLQNEFHWWYPYWLQLDFDEQLSHVINDNVEDLLPDNSEEIVSHFGLHWSINRLYQLIDADVDRCIIRFEDLIGPKGGGSKEAQMEALYKIATFLGMHSSFEESYATLEVIAENIFGDKVGSEKENITYLVGKESGLGGKIGKWKLYFTDEHIDLFKHWYPTFLVDFGYEEDNDWGL